MNGVIYRTPLVAAATLAAAATAFAADFTVSNVQVRQRWPWEHKVDIDFDLDGDDGYAADISVKLFDGETELTVPSAALSGDLFGLTRGTHRIVFEPTNTLYVGQKLLRFRAALTATETPLYMIVDLDKAVGADGQKTYVTRSDLESGRYGACVTNPVAGVSSLVWTDVTNDVYKTTKLVFRRINAGSFKTGGGGYSFNSSNWLVPSAYPATNTVVIAQAFYIGVFELTQAQVAKMKGSNYSRFKTDARLPMEYMSYDEIRGGEGSAVNWPSTGYGTVAETSQLHVYRTNTGIQTIDLPTDAQWEYACRAGTTTLLNDGVVRTFDTVARNAGVTAIDNAINEFGPSATMGEFIETRAGASTAVVGLRAPNAWGLYDMHGNVAEWCLDWAPAGYTKANFNNTEYDTSLQMARFDGVDSAGCSTGTARVMHGGSWNLSGVKGTSAFRYGYSPATKNNMFGFRLVCYPDGVTPVIGTITPPPPVEE